jgi:hypothetical protein
MRIRGTRNTYHYITSGQTALPVDSMGAPWNGSYVFSSGNIKLDLLHNFFLECGARANKIRVYEMVDDPVARQRPLNPESSTAARRCPAGAACARSLLVCSACARRTGPLVCS